MPDIRLSGFGGGIDGVYSQVTQGPGCLGCLGVLFFLCFFLPKALFWGVLGAVVALVALAGIRSGGILVKVICLPVFAWAAILTLAAVFGW